MALVPLNRRQFLVGLSLGLGGSLLPGFGLLCGVLVEDFLALSAKIGDTPLPANVFLRGEILASDLAIIQAVVDVCQDLFYIRLKGGILASLVGNGEFLLWSE